MNELILTEVSKKRVVYEYKPNGEGEPGEIVYNLEAGKVEVSKNAGDDESGYFARRAVTRVSEYVGKKNLPMQAIQAWY